VDYEVSLSPVIGPVFAKLTEMEPRILLSTVGIIVYLVVSYI